MATPVCLCERPVIILHPNARDYILRAGSFVWRGHHYTLSKTGMYSYASFFYDFPYRKFSARRNNITLDKLDDLQALDCNSGELVPLYMAVPCGHCDVCTHRKTREFAFRCVCESYTNQCSPFFVTLTYNDAHLPKDGVCKRDVQNFIKRLRINLTRSSQRDDFRFVCTSEYGKDFTHRPHYHLLIWNLPTDNLHNTLKLLQTAWSYRKGKRVSSFGFVQVKYCTSVNYVLKYMYKSCEVPAGKNELFHLSSRGKKGGIGSAYCDKMASYIKSNPELVSFSCFDPSSKRVVTCSLPQYFKRRIYKTKSLIVPKELRDKFENYCYLVATRNFYERNFIKEDLPITQWPYEEKINKLFGCLSPIVPPAYDNFLRPLFDKDYENNPHIVYRDLVELNFECEQLASELLASDLSCLEKVVPYAELCESRRIALSKLDIPPIDVKLYASNIREMRKRIELSRKL